jgi:hypothetical protein
LADERRPIHDHPANESKAFSDTTAGTSMSFLNQALLDMKNHCSQRHPLAIDPAAGASSGLRSPESEFAHNCLG